MRYPLLILIAIYFTPIYGQSSFDPIGASTVAHANTSTIDRNIWSGFHNPAGLNEVKKTELAINFQNAYLIPAFNAGTFAVSIPVKKVNTFLGIHRFGDNIYNEHRFSAAIASKVGIISFGARLNYLQSAIIDFQNSHEYSIDLGVISYFSRHILLGILINNISSYETSMTEIPIIPTRLAIGLQYNPLEFLALNLEIEKDLREAAFFKSSFQYLLKERWSFSTGLKTDSWQSFYGIGLVSRSIQIDYALSIHTVLGSSHNLSLIYRKK